MTWLISHDAHQSQLPTCICEEPVLEDHNRHHTGAEGRRLCNHAWSILQQPITMSDTLVCGDYCMRVGPHCGLWNKMLIWI